jgi:hypothetical protein
LYSSRLPSVSSMSLGSSSTSRMLFNVSIIPPFNYRQQAIGTRHK